jgi:predicted MPP superfamily phosphohydrolase
MKILSIGDIHGKSIWKDKLFKSQLHFDAAYKFFGHEELSLQVASLPINEFDKIIFIGDYVDSFTIGNAAILQNLQDLIACKKAFPDKIVLLLGNHDIQYITGRICSGFRPEMQFDLSELFRNNLQLFQLAFSYKFSDGRNFLWTHAGVTEEWFQLLLLELQEGRFAKDFDDFLNEDENYKTVAEILNWAFERNENSLFNVDSDSGGRSLWAGPLWVRPTKLRTYALNSFHQVVGHMPQKTVSAVNSSSGHSIYIIDTLEYGDQTTLTLQDL